MKNLRFALVAMLVSITACSINHAKRDGDKTPEADAAKPAAEAAPADSKESSVTLLPAEKAKEEEPKQDKITVTSADSENAKLPAHKETPAEEAAAGAANGGKETPPEAAKAEAKPEEAKASAGPEVTLIPAKKAEKESKTPALKHVKGKGVDAKTALMWLQHGNTRFVKGAFRKDGESKKDIARLSSGQHPHAIVLSCSDSRVPPELVFDQRLGEIYVVRTLGEALDDNTVASIEYGLEQLGIKLVIVMGHNSCGAINAAIEIPEGGNAGSPAMNKLAADIRPRIKSDKEGATQPDAAKESFANAKGIADDLKSRSAIIKEATESGDVKIVPALYHVENGKVTF